MFQSTKFQSTEFQSTKVQPSEFQSSEFQSSEFQPTHYLVSRTRHIPVQLLTTPQGAQLLTEIEWQQGLPAAFSMHPKRGFFCHDIQVIGFRLEPIASHGASASVTAAHAQNNT
jgi:hypothetical protein